MDGKEILARVTDEMLLRSVNKELENAKKDQQENTKKALKARSLALLLIEGAFERIPKEAWKELGLVLIQAYKTPQGRPSGEGKYIEITDKYYRLRIDGMSDSATISELSASGYYEGDIADVERSIRRALSEGRKFKKRKVKEYIEYMEREYGEKLCYTVEMLKTIPRPDKKE
jgi:hypothetical protein